MQLSIPAKYECTAQLHHPREQSLKDEFPQEKPHRYTVRTLQAICGQRCEKHQ